MLRRGVYVWCENGEAIGWRRYNGHYSSIAVGVEEHFSMAFPLHIYYIRQVRGSFRARFVNTLWSVLAALWGVMEVS